MARTRPPLLPSPLPHATLRQPGRDRTPYFRAGNTQFHSPQQEVRKKKKYRKAEKQKSPLPSHLIPSHPITPHLIPKTRLPKPTHPPTYLPTYPPPYIPSHSLPTAFLPTVFLFLRGKELTHSSLLLHHHHQHRLSPHLPSTAAGNSSCYCSCGG